MMENFLQASHPSKRIFKNKKRKNGAQVFTGHLSQALNDHSLVSISDIKGNITYANSKFCEVSGYSLEELMGANHRILKSDVHDDKFYKNLWKTIASGQAWHGEICNKDKNGQLYWVQSTIVPFLDNETGKMEHYIAIRTEITHQKELQKKLDNLFMEAISASEEKSNFLTNISHELRTPLNHIIGFSEILEMETDNASLLENVGYIKMAGYELLRKIDNILELVDSGDRFAAPAEAINIVNLVNSEFGGSFKNNAEKFKRKFIYTIPDQEIYINANSMDLINAFSKIADNAIRFSTIDDIVGVGVSVEDDTVIVAIFDTGPGLPQEILLSSLEPFIIGEKVITKTNSGMGLGLPIAKRLCILNGGEFEMESDAEIGTKIYFKFPIAS